MFLRLFPVWAVLLSVVAFYKPAWFSGFEDEIVSLLTLVILAMGLTLTLEDFKKVLKSREALLVGVLLQFLIMPFAAFLTAYCFGFGQNLTIGMLLVGSVAGGTSSAVMCYLAKGDVALSISMTAITTLLSVVLTPLLMSFMVEQSVHIPTISNFLYVLKIILLPVAAGVLINTLFYKAVRKAEPLLPYASMIAIILIIAIVVSASVSRLTLVGPTIITAVIFHNGIGLGLGYWVAYLLGFDKRVCRTIALGVGLQNSALAVTLAFKFFTPIAALPGTVFSIWHNISGSLLASYWGRSDVDGDTCPNASSVDQAVDVLSIRKRIK